MNLIIADMTLQDFAGHSFEYSRCLSHAAENRGYRCVTLARNCVTAEVTRAIAAIPCFSNHAGPLSHLPVPVRILRRCWNQCVHARMMLQDLKEAEPRIELNAKSVVVAPTVYWNHIVPFARWAEQIASKRRPRFALILHTSAYPEFTNSDHRERLYRYAFARLERSQARQNFHLFADTEELVEELQSYTNMPVNWVPIPHSGGTSGINLPAPLRRDVNPPIRITQLGFSNGLNKGFQHFAPLFHRLRPYFESGQIVAELQASISHAGWRQVQTALRRLREMSSVTLHEGPLSSEDYYGLLERAGIVVLPYSTETYHSQTSGVFSEAVAHGKPVVVPRGTWMARQLKDHAAGVTFIPKDLQSLYESVVEAIERYRELGDLAVQRAARWRHRHSAPAYLDTIFQAIGVR
jgi:glycosyltransferase involved in cell wall biosynthesis